MKKHDDLFHDTTMTFGEHLDELRVSLFKAVIGLMIGVAVGLYFGNNVVHVIQAPLEKSLATYYANHGVTRYEEWAADRETKGLPIPYTQEEVKALIKEQGMLFDIQYVDPEQAVAEARLVDPTLGGTTKTPPGDAKPPGDASPPPKPTANELPEKESGPAAEGAERAHSEADPKNDVPLSEEAKAAARDLKKRLAPIFVFHPVNEDARVRAKAMSITESFSIWLKASLVLGVVISSPWVFFQIWSFVAAGLYPHEKKYVYLFMPFSLGLFLLGAATAYFFVFAPVLDFLLSYNESLNIDPEPRIGEWLGFVLLLPLGFGVSFQLPLVMLFLERIGIFSVRAYLEKWRIAVLVIFILSAVLTPADPYSILFMAVPLTVLYFGGVLLCHYLPKSGGTGTSLERH